MCYGESLLPLSSLVTDFSRRTGKTDVEEAESDCRNVVHSGALCCLSCLAGFNYDLLVRLSHSGNALPLVDGRAKDNTGSRRGSRAALRTAVLVVGGGVVGSSAIVFLSRPPYCARISQGNAGNLRIASACESGGIGRRTRLRIWRGNPWGFKSPLSHQQVRADSQSRPFSVCPPSFPKVSSWVSRATYRSMRPFCGQRLETVSPEGARSIPHRT